MGKYFGTDGFRGEANRELTCEHAYKIGRFLGWYYKGETKAKIAIGKDTRRSSYMLEYSLVAGISASGGEAHLLHVTTTPCVAYITRVENFHCGIMISASHNSFEDNGIKLFDASGEKMGENLIAQIENYIDEKCEEIPLAFGEEIGKVEDYLAGRNRYLAHLVGLAVHSYKGVRVGLDTSNGSAYAIARSVFESLGAKVTIVASSPDGLNINCGCGSTNIENLQKLVVENNLDIGFAFDGDADRCLLVDEKGSVVDGDKVLYIYAKYMQERGVLKSGKITATVMSNFGLFKSVEELGIGYYKTKVGDKYVYENMQENGVEIGGEPSGHTIFRKYETTGDGILTAMKIMQVMLDKKTPLSVLASGMKVYPQVVLNVKVKDKTLATTGVAVQAKIEEISETLGETGRVLVRESGTEQVVRILVECENKEKCEAFALQIAEKIKEGAGANE